MVHPLNREKDGAVRLTRPPYLHFAGQGELKSLLKQFNQSIIWSLVFSLLTRWMHSVVIPTESVFRHFEA